MKIICKYMSVIYECDPNRYFNSKPEWTWRNGNGGVLNTVQISRTGVRGAFNKFPYIFFCTDIWNCRRLLRIPYVIVIHLMRWLANFNDLRFKWTATAAIGIHPTKAWLSQLVSFKHAIWTWGHFRRTICNKIVF